MCTERVFAMGRNASLGFKSTISQVTGGRSLIRVTSDSGDDPKA